MLFPDADTSHVEYDSALNKFVDEPAVYRTDTRIQGSEKDGVRTEITNTEATAKAAATRGCSDAIHGSSIQMAILGPFAVPSDIFGCSERTVTNVCFRVYRH